jgi:HTH-type transcriptional regulator/antitoxin MqsA
MNTSTICPVCGEGTLQADQAANIIAYNGSQLTVPRVFHWCNVCGTELTLTDDARINARVCMSEKQKVLGKVTGKSIRELRKYLGITQENAGKIFGGGPVAFCKYENDDLAPSEPMDNLLWLVQKFPSLAKDLAERNGCTLSEECTRKIASDVNVAFSEIDEASSQRMVTSITNALSVSHLGWASACVANTHAEPENQNYSLIFAEAA